MTPEEQRIAIAEACGWKENGLGPKGTLHDPKGCSCFDGKGCWIPDYLNDLNAMHEAEKTLTDEQWLDYFIRIADLTVPNQFRDDPGFVKIISATATQRAEAFLRTIGKWTQ